jgi:peptide chain release factor subunit 1
MSAPQANEAEKNIEIWKVKKLIKRLEAAFVHVSIPVMHS